MKDRFPSLVTIRGIQHFCTGVLVNEHHVLTTATCIDELGSEQRIAMTGQSFPENEVSHALLRVNHPIVPSF